MSEPFDMRLAVSHTMICLDLCPVFADYEFGTGTGDADFIYLSILAMTEFVKLIGPVPHPERYVPQGYARVAHVILFWACKNAGCDYGYEFWDAHPDLGKPAASSVEP
jgi:hypothetical protein